MTTFDHRFRRSILIPAARSTVFASLTNAESFGRWWGEGSSIEARPGGTVLISHPNGVVVLGEVIAAEAHERLAFTYGYESGKPIALGASRVTFELDDAGEAGTRLELVHEFGDAATRDAHEAGWRYHLAVFANVAADAQHANCAATLDAFFAAWALTDTAERGAALAPVVTDDVGYRDRFACVAGREDFDAHIAALQQHMPSGSVTRQGAPQHCQGTALAEWIATSSDGSPLGAGTTIFDLAADGRIRRAVALWR